jgi:SPP1 gp7 family putative phage head morphogenesis protein
MNILDIFRRKTRVPGTNAPESGWQIRPTDGQGALTKYFATFVPRKIEGAFYEFLVETIPICGAAISRLVTLDGVPIVTGQNQKLVDEINDWLHHVPVNDTAGETPLQAGLQAFHQAQSREAFEQGFGIGEYITNPRRNDITNLRVGDSKYIKFSRETGQGIRIYQRADGDTTERELNPANLLYFSINNENQNPYGTPILRGSETCAKILATIYNATQNSWERFGDPSFSVVYKTSRKDGTDLESRKTTIANELNTALRAKAAGKSADFVRAIDTNSDITIKVIGADGQLLEMDVPARYMIQDICGITGLPSWMLGYSFSTTERRANFEAEMVLADVVVRQAAKGAHYERLIATLLRLRGRTWKPGDWQLEWKQVNLHDLVAQAQARFLNAQADQMTSTAGKTPEITTQQPKKTACGCGSSESIEIKIDGGIIGQDDWVEKHLVPAIKGAMSGHKETRPTPWPELDTVETNYENRLKTDWRELQERIYTIVKLDPASIALGMGKDETPPFTFSQEQRAAVMNAMNNAIGEYALDADDNPITWYYGQAYSLGLIQAAHLVGQERPNLDLLKNQEIFDELVANGFGLLKDNTTRAILDKILPEMEAHTLAGSNPMVVASRLNKHFGDQNSSWERLARTEMALAAETAKTDEWAAYGVKMVEFYPAPDACPICQSLKGNYALKKCPQIPIHPRCRCTKRPAASETEQA